MAKNGRVKVRGADRSIFKVGMIVRTNYDRTGVGRYIEGVIERVTSDYVYLKDATYENGSNQGTWSIYLLTGGNYWIEFPYAKELNSKNVTMDTVVLPDDKKEQIQAAISQLDYTDKIFKEWGFESVFEKGTAVSLLFYGTPGTGKTLMAQAIANKCGLDLKIIQSGEIESSEPGQAERNIKAFFENAERQKQLLCFDECDSLICDRNEVGMILAGQINALLTGLENFTGVCVFTTNRLGKMDAAFERRVSAKIEFPFPDEQARTAIWKKLIPAKAPLGNDVKLKKLAKFPIAGGNIKNVVLNAARYAAYHKKPTIDMECFYKALEKEIESLKGFEAALSSQPKIPAYRGGGGDIGKSDSGLSVDKVKSEANDFTKEVDKVIEEI